MTDSNTKIGWVLSGSAVVPGARIQGFNIHAELCEQGIESSILVAPSDYSLSLSRDGVDWRGWIQDGYSTIVFQKVFEGETVHIARSLRAADIRTVYLACDLCGHDMVDTCDVTIAVSSFLKKAFGRRRADKITVVPDGLEAPVDRKKEKYRSVENDRLKAVYVGSAFPEPDILNMLNAVSDLVELTIVASRYEPHADMSAPGDHRVSFGKRPRDIMDMHPVDLWAKLLRKLVYACRSVRARFSAQDHNSSVAYDFVPWSRDTVVDVVLRHDVALIPSFLVSDHDMVKSSNRLTMFMSLGLPVVASPVPSYLEVIRDGENGFIASTKKDWICALEMLRGDGIAETIGRRAREEVIEQFSLQATAARYLAVFGESKR